MTTDPNVRRYFVVMNDGSVWGHEDFVRIVEVHDDDLHVFVEMSDSERAALARNHGKRPEIGGGS
jgi:hypothetical protein